MGGRPDQFRATRANPPFFSANLDQRIEIADVDDAYRIHWKAGPIIGQDEVVRVLPVSCFRVREKDEEMVARFPAGRQPDQLRDIRGIAMDADSIARPEPAYGREFVEEYRDFCSGVVIIGIFIQMQHGRRQMRGIDLRFLAEREAIGIDARTDHPGDRRITDCEHHECGGPAVACGIIRAVRIRAAGNEQQSQENRDRTGAAAETRDRQWRDREHGEFQISDG